MKKKRTVFLLSLLFAILLSCSVSAEESSVLPSEFSELVESLPDEIRDKLPGEIYSDDADKIAKAVGEMSNFEYIASLIGEVIGLEIGKKLSLFAILMGVVLLVSIFNSFKSGLIDGALSKAVGFCSSAVIFSLMTTNILSDLGAVKGFFERISVLITGVIPVVGVVYAMGGNVTTAAASSGTLYLFLSFCETVLARTVIPVSAMLTAFSLCSAFSQNIRLSALSSALRKCYTVFLTLVMSVLLFVLSSQTLLSTSADSISARAAKLMASSAIPIVGGSVGETFRTVGATVSYIKSVTGLGGIFFVFILVLPIIVSLLITRLFLILSSSAAEMLGCDSEGKILSEIGGIYGTLIAVVSAVAVSFILALGVFVRCAVAVG